MLEIGLNKKQIILPFSILAFHPVFIFMARLINNDELVEVTPRSIRLRKKILNTEERKKFDSKKAKMKNE